MQCKYVDKVLNVRGEDIDHKKYPFTESDYVSWWEYTLQPLDDILHWSANARVEDIKNQEEVVSDTDKVFLDYGNKNTDNQLAVLTNWL